MILLISTRGNNEHDGAIALFAWLIITKYFALITGGISLIAAIILRILKNPKYNGNFMYTLFGTLNCCLGIGSLIAFAFTRANIFLLHDFIPNLVLGTLILSDIFLFNRSSPS